MAGADFGAIVVLGYIVWDRTFRALGDMTNVKDVRPQVVEVQGPPPALLQQAVQCTVDRRGCSRGESRRRRTFRYVDRRACRSGQQVGLDVVDPA